MSRSTWIKHPGNARPTCHCTVLPLTLKALQLVAKKYKQNSKLNWHRVEFQYITVVARVLELDPILTLSDNTAIFRF